MPFSGQLSPFVRAQCRDGLVHLAITIYRASADTVCGKLQIDASVFWWSLDPDAPHEYERKRDLRWCPVCFPDKTEIPASPKTSGAE